MGVKKNILLGLITGLVIAGGSCYNDKEQLLYPAKYACGATPVSFSKDLLPLIQTSCGQGSGCHGAGSTAGPGPLTNYAEISAAGARLSASVQAGRMPLGGSLTSAQLKVINCWVNNGMLNN